MREAGRKPPPGHEFAADVGQLIVQITLSDHFGFNASDALADIIKSSIDRGRKNVYLLDQFVMTGLETIEAHVRPGEAVVHLVEAAVHLIETLVHLGEAAVHLGKATIDNIKTLIHLLDKSDDVANGGLASHIIVMILVYHEPQVFTPLIKKAQVAIINKAKIRVNLGCAANFAPFTCLVKKINP